MKVTGADGKTYVIKPNADLSNADLSNLSMAGANLEGANLKNANLSNSQLNLSNLSHADLSHADLTNSNLHGANLNGANLSSINYQGIRFSSLTYDDLTIFPEGFELSEILSSSKERVFADDSRHSESSLTGIGLLRILAWIWLIFSPIGGIILWSVVEQPISGLFLFLSASLSGVVIFAVFLVLATIAENLIAIKKEITSNTQPQK